MSKVVVDISVSADGYVAAPNRSADEPMGEGGERLHEWVFASDDRQDRAVMEQGLRGLGAVIAGRRTYDDSVRWWGPDGPSGSARRPLFVVTHEEPAESPEGGVYTFCTDGIRSALDQARAAAGEQTVAVMGGASIIEQVLAEKLVDEISLHVVPVLFGGGTPLNARLGNHVELETLDAVKTSAAVHTRYRVVRGR
jgi:dihydrofolate reductase